MKIFITGISSGLGRAMAKEFVHQGHDVWGIARRENLLQALADEIRSTNFSYTPCDLNNEKQIALVKQQLQEKAFYPEVIILNAATENFDPNDFTTTENIIKTNVLGNLRCLDTLLPLAQRNTTAQIIAISSLNALLPDENNYAYCASKSALSMAMRALRLRLKKEAIPIKILYLGPVNTGYKASWQSSKKQGGFLVQEEDTVVKKISHIIYSKKSNHYLPFYLYFVQLLFNLLPDQVFAWITNRFRR